MGYKMEYSSGLTSKSFWYPESKKTAKIILDGLNRKEIIEMAINNNIYQVESKLRAKKIANALYTRLNSLSHSILEYVVNSDIHTSKILVLISIMKTDRLLFEFMFEVFRSNIILGNYSLKDRDFNIFFQDKKAQSEIIDNWADSTIQRLKWSYITIISNAGLIRTDSNKREIILPFFDYNVKKNLFNNNMAHYVFAITGEE